MISTSYRIGRLVTGGKTHFTSNFPSNPWVLSAEADLPGGRAILCPPPLRGGGRNMAQPQVGFKREPRGYSGEEGGQAK